MGYSNKHGPRSTWRDASKWLAVQFTGLEPREVLEGLEGESPWGWIVWRTEDPRGSLANGHSPDPAGLAPKYSKCWLLTVLLRQQFR